MNKTTTPAAPKLVRYASNPKSLVATNRLIDPDLSQTLENCTAVLQFLSEFHSRERSKSGDDEYGEVLVIDWVADALERQCNAIRAHDTKVDYAESAADHAE